MASVKENLMAARALIDTPEKWGKGEDPTSPPDCGFCAMNACSESSETVTEEFELYRSLKLHLPVGAWVDHDLPIAAFNDHPETTHADIMALFDRAIAACDEQVAA